MHFADILRVIVLAFGNQINILFTLSMLAIFFISIANYSGLSGYGEGWASRIAEGATATLPSLGILGTFLGISIGLLNFQPELLEQSVPMLLEGMKTAFVTSVVGIALGTLLKLYGMIFGQQDTQPVTTDEAVGEIAASFRLLVESHSETNATLVRIRSSIAGDEDASLITQLQKIRTQQMDAHAEMKQCFAEFSKTLADNNAKALIAALNEVIQDFNVKLTEQFGDNFKQLNSAVGAMVVWQENYKAQAESWMETAKAELSVLRKFLDSAVESIQEARDALGAIKHDMTSIPPVLNEFKSLIAAMENELALIKNGLGALSELRENARRTIPEVNDKLNSLVESFHSGIDAVVKSSKSNVDRQDQALTAQLRQLEEMNRQSREAFERTIKATSDNLAKQVGNLDDAMQEEVRRVVEVMGGHLASLSNQFVSDYTPLTQRLKEVVEIANGFGRNSVRSRES